MIHAVNYALSALQASERRLSVHAHNVANVSTPGFKSSRATQSTLPGGGTKIASIQRHFQSGALDITNIPTDYAVNGQGYIALQNGQLTRNGAFSYDAEGNLVTAGGVAVDLAQGVVTVPNQDGLRAEGESQFSLSEVSGQAFPSSSSLVQGALETSNTDVVGETVGSILAQRAFEFNLSTIKTADEMMGTLLDMVA